MFGIPAAHCLSAEGLDIRGNDPEAILRAAEGPAAALAGSAERLRDVLRSGGRAEARPPVFLPGPGKADILWSIRLCRARRNGRRPT